MSYPAHWYFRMYPPPAAEDLVAFVEELLGDAMDEEITCYAPDSRPGWIAIEEERTWYEAEEVLATMSGDFLGATLVLHATYEDAPAQAAYYARDGKVVSVEPPVWEPPPPEKVSFD